MLIRQESETICTTTPKITIIFITKLINDKNFITLRIFCFYNYEEYRHSRNIFSFYFCFQVIKTLCICNNHKGLA